MPYVIAESCIDVKDKSCVEACPVDCIYDGGDQLLINPDECIDCGACLPECPVNAIYEDEDEAIEKDGTDEYVKRNYKFFGLEYNG